MLLYPYFVNILNILDILNDGILNKIIFYIKDHIIQTLFTNPIIQNYWSSPSPLPFGVRGKLPTPPLPRGGGVGNTPYPSLPKGVLLHIIFGQGRQHPYPFGEGRRRGKGGVRGIKKKKKK